MESISQAEYRGAFSRSFRIAYQKPLIQYPTIYSFGQLPMPARLGGCCLHSSCSAAPKVNLHKARSGLHMTGWNMALWICTWAVEPHFQGEGMTCKF